MTRTILTHLGAALLGLLGGYVIGYTGTIRLMIYTLNKMIKEREEKPDIAAQMEMPGLTLFRATVRLRRF